MIGTVGETNSRLIPSIIIEYSQQRNACNRHCLNSVIIIRCIGLPRDSNPLFPSVSFLLFTSPPRLTSIYHLIYYPCSISKSFTMFSLKSRQVITIDMGTISLIAIWCFVGVAFLVLCCCLCCVSISPSSLDPHTNLTYISLTQCDSGTSKREFSDSEPEVDLDELESAWPRYPERVLCADSVETLPRYSAVDGPPKYTRSVRSEHC